MRMQDEHISVSHPYLKLVTAWFAAIGVSSWSEFASLLACLYTLCLIGEWTYRKFFKGRF